MRLRRCATSLLSPRSAVSESSTLQAMTFHCVFERNGVPFATAECSYEKTAWFQLKNRIPSPRFRRVGSVPRGLSVLHGVSTTMMKLPRWENGSITKNICSQPNSNKSRC
jgi:hypothetical protein